MTNHFDELIRSFDISSNKILNQIKDYFPIEQTDEILVKFVNESYSSLVILEQNIWQILNIDYQQYFEQFDCLNFFQSIANWNKKFIFNQNEIDLKLKSALFIPKLSLDRIFQTIEQINNDNHPLIIIISHWFDNLAYFVHEYPQLGHLPIIIQVNQQFLHRFLMSELFKIYLNQLQHSTDITHKQMFYIKTCSLSLNVYFYANPQICDDIFEEILPRIGTDYLDLIQIHSSTVKTWNNELLGCLAHLIGFMRAFLWWEGEKGVKIRILLPTESILCNYIQALIRMVSYEPFHKNILMQWSNTETIFIDSIFLSLMNIIQSCDINWFFRTLVEFQELILKFARLSVYFRIHLCVYGILSRTLTDDDLKALQITDSIKFFFFPMLEQAWNAPSKRYKQIPIEYLLQGFLNLSKNDLIQQRVVSLNNIGLFTEMCDQYAIVYDILWALSFNKDIQEQLRSNANFMSKIVRLNKECIDEQAKKAIDGILWNLEINHDDRSKTDIKNRETFDIMISYSHKDKQLCKQIYDELIKSNYRVWIDFDQMHGNVMDAMAQGIESAKTVIICMSEEYRKSNFCRAEAHYAFQRQRKIVPVLLEKHYRPDGWLLFLIGQLLYVDFNKHEFTRAMEMLYQELKIEESYEIPVRSKDEPTMLEWTNVEVQQWLIQNKFHQISRLLIDFDGRSLVYFGSYLKKSQPHQVLNLMQTESVRRLNENLSLIELCRLHSLIDKEKTFFQFE